MKFCLRLRIDAGEALADLAVDGIHDVKHAEIVDMGLVGDDHEFGLDADGFLHYEARYLDGTMTNGKAR